MELIKYNFFGLALFSWKLSDLNIVSEALKGMIVIQGAQLLINTKFLMAEFILDSWPL